MVRVTPSWPPLSPRVVHGGPDGGPPVRWDFSTNANPLPHPPALTEALAQADRHRYPDPAYAALRRQLGAVWSCAPERVQPTSGSSEAIRRLTLAARLRGIDEVWLTWPAYGDYAAAAQALGMAVRHHADATGLLNALVDEAQVGRGPVLVWLNEPCNPTGASLSADVWHCLQGAIAEGACIVGLDRAYEPLRLLGDDPVPAATADLCWQLWSPNKALGLTGVRAGVVVAPETDALDGAAVRLHSALRQAFGSLAPSWVLSAEGVALLQAWWLPETQSWLAECRATLLETMQTQRDQLSALGWVHRPSVVPFGLSRPACLAPEAMPAALAHLRTQGIQLRDTTSMGLPGWWRLSTLPAPAQADLRAAWLSLPEALCHTPSAGPGSAPGPRPLTSHTVSNEVQA
ncbi:pyridoxal phosphate-dependent aminotransferase [Aquabacterium sp.]|uniref:pyridoxal phosphate-dependent aminotransferase n=1 Tax=Aquabacterium sp. TaxID=1872578 RepID=UPI0025C06051|nr:pyridoxal phosphate-dependent aminotransferase [Aquabacterium sp.]